MAKDEAKLPVRATFRGLVEQEDAWLRSRPGAASNVQLEQEVSEPTDADEPWITFTNRDRFGIALSGGGIRSATFNLGVLQALGAKGILDHVDYLSTVSGGGYVGGFWTSLRHHLGGATPQPLAERTPANAETAAVRHLREFSRFLVPRVGFAHAETWAGIVAVIGGMLPTLVAAGALIAALMYAFLGASWALLQASVAFGALTFGLLTLVIQLGAELRWHAHEKGGDSARWINGVLVAIVAALVGAATWYAARASRWSASWCTSPGHWTDGAQAPFCAYVFYPAAAWCVVAVSLLVLTALLSRWRKASSPIDRAAGRFLATAMIWALAAGVWEGARLLDQTSLGYGVTVGSAATAGGLFVWLRKWLGSQPEETRGGALLGRVVGYLKPLTPQLLAVIAVLALFVAFTALLQRFGNPAVYGFLAILIVGGFAAVLFDPAKLGLHDFYRGRIARCYLGAARADLRAARPSVEQPDDEIPIKELLATKQGPIHLVCCAANNLSGDPLVGLYRGARSAVVSPFGISVGGFSSSVDGLGLSAALTASAAAFNSQMGAVSMQLGPAVAFLMTALNLRLGLWVPHPLSPPQEYRFPGRFLLFEALGMTRCDPVPPKLALALADNGAEPAKLSPELETSAWRRALHLSDGGHFENLALYELVRRHCRYIIVSDASADPEVAFDDLANAVRRVREDFGVEIEIDVSPLRPNGERISKQHAVIGTIHFDGLGGSDKGVILYLKPTLVGDEPTDVTQYRARNLAFPHEGTADQFYDEAQWESYRRLGEHVAGVTFGFVDQGWPSEANFVERMFQAASQRWHLAQRGQSEIFLSLTQRCSEIETDIRDNAPPALRDEFFPEVQALVGARAAAAPQNAQDEIRTLYFLMQVAQVMEDVWLAAELDRFWSHPLNEGWMSYFHRWTSTPSFRRWWPVLRPIYSVGFRDFVKDRFGLRVKDDFARIEPSGPGAELELAPVDPSKLRGLAVDHFLRRNGAMPRADSAFEYRLNLAPDQRSAQPIQVGFLTFNEADAPDKTAVWKSADLFVSPPLIGGGIISRFLDATLKRLKADGYAVARVILDDAVAADVRPTPRTAAPRRTPRDPASRQERISTINFYKSRGFVYTKRNRGARTLELRLG